MNRLAIWSFCFAACVAFGADLAELVRRAKPAILELYPLDSRGEELGQASGFFWDNDGYALTNYHVIRGATSVAARSLSGARYQSEGPILRLGDLDVVLLHFKANNTPYIATAPASAEITEGEHIDGRALKNLVRAAVDYNKSKKKKAAGRKR